MLIELGLWSAAAPLALLLVSSLWQYPAVLEEVVKWVILRKGQSQNWRLSGVVVGAAFGISEAILYTMNAWSGAQWGAAGTRLVLTVPMHAATAVVIAWGNRHKKGGWGLLAAMVIHGVFNYLVV